jgi:hypothetical protein
MNGAAERLQRMIMIIEAWEKEHREQVAQAQGTGHPASSSRRA